MTTFICDATHLWVVLFLKTRDETFVQKFRAYAENLLEDKVRVLRDDKGGEYISKEFEAFLTASGDQETTT